MLKIYMSLPIVVGKAVVWGRRQNSVCGLSFCPSRGRTNEMIFLDVAIKYL